MTERELDQILKRERTAWTKFQRLLRRKPPDVDWFHDYEQVIDWSNEILTAEQEWRDHYDESVEAEEEYLDEHSPGWKEE